MPKIQMTKTKELDGIESILPFHHSIFFPYWGLIEKVFGSTDLSIVISFKGLIIKNFCLLLTERKRRNIMLKAPINR
jgi:hypothetical protein